MKRKGVRSLALALCLTAIAPSVWGCGDVPDGKIEVEIVQYKPEAANYFKTVEEAFNASHKDIHLTISSPNDAMAILKTRFIREDYPDIIGTIPTLWTPIFWRIFPNMRVCRMSTRDIWT